MKAKTTLLIFSQKDFAVSIVNASASKYFLLAIVFALFSFNGFAQLYPLHNGRTIIKHHKTFPPNLTTNQTASYAGVNPFFTSDKSSRIQMIYTSDELFDSGAMTGTITHISFRVAGFSSNQHFTFQDLTVRLGLTTLNSFEGSNDMYIPESLQGLTTVRSGFLKFTAADYDFANDGAVGGWLTITLDQPYEYDLTGGQNLIVEIAKSEMTFNNASSTNQRIFVSKYLSTQFIGLRGCHRTINAASSPLGKDMFTSSTGNSVNTVAVTNPTYRSLRPHIKLTYLATAENSNNFIYTGVPATPLCIGDPITIGVTNMYASGYLGFVWKRSNASNTGYSNFDNSENDLDSNPLTLQILQGGEPFSYILEPILPNNQDFIYLDQSYAVVPTVPTYENGSWIGTPPSAGQSAYYKTTPPSWPITNDVMELCSVKVAPGVVLTVPAGKTLKVDRILKTDDIQGKIVFENNAALLQNTEEINDATNVIYKRESQPLLRYDFTHYSSPMNGTNLQQVSPATLWDKYFMFDNNDWVFQDHNTIMTPGRGYIIRAPQGYNISGDRQTYTAVFAGKPNNGNISSPVDSVVDHFNLIGNPYPSAVDVGQFIYNNQHLEGSIHLWDHTISPTQIPGTNFYGYSNTDYTTLNGLGSTNGSSPFKVAAGQSFMVKTIVGGISTAVWKNTMRIGDNDVLFHKFNNTQLNRHDVATVEAAGRFWLELQANNGNVQRMLIGYIQGATEDYDRMYDAEHMGSGNTMLYAVANNEQHLSIMAKGLPFNNEEIIPLGFATTISGNHTIVKFLEDGFMPEYVVYLNDKLTNTVHNLSEGSYTFASAAGTFNDRFVIAFKAKTQVGEQNAITPNRVVIFDKHENVQLHSGQDNMSTIIVYDLSGRVLVNVANCKSPEVAIANLPRKNQLLIVEIHLENGVVETQKFRF